MYSYYTDLQGWYGRSGKLKIKYDTEKIILFIYLSTKQLFDLVKTMTCIIQQYLFYKNVLEKFYHVPVPFNVLLRCFYIMPLSKYFGRPRRENSVVIIRKFRIYSRIQLIIPEFIGFSFNSVKFSKRDSNLQELYTIFWKSQVRYIEIRSKIKISEAFVRKSQALLR